MRRRTCSSVWSKGVKSMEKLIILYEDNHLIVVVKPQNTPSMDDISGDESMYSLVKDYIKEKYQKTGNVFLGIVHRLDRPTGGIMIFAKTSKCAERLSKQIRDNEVHKTYYCVTTRSPKQREETLTHYLKKDEKNNIVQIVPPLEKGAKKAVLHYKVLQTEGELALLEVKLITGRSHQIRVQLASIGCAIYGDNKYGLNKSTSTKNLALWAGRIEFTHPVTKQNMTFAIAPSGNPFDKFYLDKYFLR